MSACRVYLFVCLSQCIAACITLPLIETVPALRSGEAAYYYSYSALIFEVQCTFTPIVCGEHPPAPVVLG
jgi:hypothetical protein